MSGSEQTRTPWERYPAVTVGGLPIAVITRTEEAQLLLASSRSSLRGTRPVYFTSANGEVIARAAADAEVAAHFLAADQIVADGQPMVLASRYLCAEPLPERVATTDLFHDVAALAQNSGHTFYLLGGTPEENARAAASVQSAYPRLQLLGAHHGYLQGAALAEKLEEIDQLAPDILWLGMGVPREQAFVRTYGGRLNNVGLIKTSGGLFNFLSGKNARAPGWMQQAGLEWVYRLKLEPRRLFWRYFTTNPVSAFLILTRSQ